MASLTTTTFPLGAKHLLPKNIREALECGLLALAYFLVARLCQSLAIPPGNITPVWLPSGIIFAAMLLRGYYLWPGIFLGAFIGNVWAYISFDEVDVLIRSATSAALNGFGDSLCAYIGARALRDQLESGEPFINVKCVLIFILFAVMLGSLVSAVFGVGGLTIFGFIPVIDFPSAFVTWWTGDAVGVLIIGSLALAFRLPSDPLLHLKTPRICEQLSYIAVFSTVIFSALYIQDSSWLGSMLFVTLPILVWSSLRLGLRYTFLSGAVISLFSVVVSVTLDPSSTPMSPNHRLISLQIFVATIIVTIMLMSAIVYQWAYAYGELLNAKGIAESANEFKSNFLSAISHELRTPMNGIVGFSDLISQTSLNTTQRKYISRIDSSARHIMSLVNELLDLAKAESGNFEIQSTSFSPKLLADEMLEQFLYLSENKSLLFKADVAVNVPEYVLGDDKRIHQLLVNLLSNAFKFTNSGEIVLSISKEENNNIRFAVKDSGLGIDDSEKSHIFIPFSQAKHNQSHHGGTGLGLHICKQLVEAMGGEIGLESEPGKGSCFWFTLSMEESDASAIIKKKSISIQNFPPLNLSILAVDDNPVNRQLVKALLNKFDCQVATAVDGQVACDMAELVKYDVILMDCMMPVMDGYEAADNIIKSNSINKHTPIIAFTADALEKNIEKCREYGMEDVATKPINSKALYGVLQKYAAIASVPPLTTRRE